MNYLDRNNIATARLGTLEKDLGLVGNQYNTIISIFFVGMFSPCSSVLARTPEVMELNENRLYFDTSPNQHDPCTTPLSDRASKDME